MTQADGKTLEKTRCCAHRASCCEGIISDGAVRATAGQEASCGHCITSTQQELGKSQRKHVAMKCSFQKAAGVRRTRRERHGKRVRSSEFSRAEVELGLKRKMKSGGEVGQLLRLALNSRPPSSCLLPSAGKTDYSVYVGIEPLALCMLGKHSAK